MVLTHATSVKIIETNQDSETEASSVTKAANKGLDAINSFKEKAKAAIRDVSQPQRSQFHDWSDSSMRQLLVDHNVEIRGAAHATRDTLVRICDDVFGLNTELDHEAQTSEKKFTVHDIVRIDRAARLIQKSFIASRRRMYEQKFHEYHKKALYLQTRRELYQAPNENNMMYHDNDSRGCYSSQYLEPITADRPLQYDTDGHVQDGTADDGQMQIETFPSPSAPVVDEEECRPLDGSTTSSFEEDEVFHTPASRTSNVTFRFGSPRTPKRSSTLRKVKHENTDKELETEWRKPSWKYAKKFESASRPHRAGREMKKYTIKDSLGRLVDLQ